jgi:hypothetical protein
MDSMATTNPQLGRRLDDILARDVGIQWAEAVALVQATCRQVLATGAAGFPTAAQIVLDGEGAVVALATKAEPQVPAAAHLLASLLGDDVPVRLRLMVSQATGGDGPYPTLNEFSAALAYFERPDPAVLLRDLHGRAALAPAPAGTRPAPTKVSTPAPAPENCPRAKNKKHDKRAAVVAIAALLCVLVGLVVTRPGGTSAAVNASVEETTASTVPQQRATPKNARDRQRLPDVAKGPAIQRKSSTAVSSVPQWRSRLDMLSPLERQPAEIGGLTLPVLRWDPGVEPSTPVIYAARDAPLSDEAEVYSRLDADVVPPRSIYPKLPAPAPGPPRPGRTVLELLISADGLVERVRLRTPPHNVHEFMLLSAAKAWRFDPATVQGHPVRFLHDVAITAPY